MVQKLCLTDIITQVRDADANAPFPRIRTLERATFIIADTKLYAPVATL